MDEGEHRSAWAVLTLGGSCCSALQSLGSNAIEGSGRASAGPKCLWRNGIRGERLGRSASQVHRGLATVGPIVVRNSSRGALDKRSNRT